MLLYEFYAQASMLARHTKDIPAKIKNMIYDVRFSRPDVCASAKAEGEVDWINCGLLSCYGHIFAQIESAADNHLLEYICESQDIGDPTECGDFYYFAGMMSYHIGVIYMKSTHEWAMPSRIYIYGPENEIRMSNYEMEVDVSPVNETVYSILRSEDKGYIRRQIKEWLSTSDRPFVGLV